MVFIALNAQGLVCAALAIGLVSQFKCFTAVFPCGFHAVTDGSGVLSPIIPLERQHFHRDPTDPWGVVGAEFYQHIPALLGSTG